MDLARLTALGIFLFTMAITPGPNNLMLTASGAAFGFRKTVPHIVGIVVGMETMFAVNALGLGAVLTAFPSLRTAFKVIGAVYLCYLAFKLIFSKGRDESRREGKPLTLLEASLFQVINPKAWIITLTAITAFTVPGDGFIPSYLSVAAAFVLVASPCISLWAGFGSVLKVFLSKGRNALVLNVGLGILMLGSLAFMLK